MLFYRQAVHLLMFALLLIVCLFALVLTGWLSPAGASPLANGSSGGQAIAFAHDARLAFVETKRYATEQVGHLIVGAPLSQTIKLTTAGMISDNFAVVVAIDGNTAVVGAPTADIDNRSDQGAAYVFVRSGTAWVQQARLVANDGVAGDQFGNAVAVAGDTILVGAYNVNDKTGAAYVFVRNGALWPQQKKLTAGTGSTEKEWFGRSVALQGDLALIGASKAAHNGNNRPGAAYVFIRNGVDWTQQQRIVAEGGGDGEEFGTAVAIDGLTAIVGAPLADVNNKSDQGAAYVFVRNGATWFQQKRLSAPDGAANDNFGIAVAASGDTALIGAHLTDVGGRPNQGAAYIFVRQNTIWSQQARPLANGGAGQDFFGAAVALEGDRALIGAKKVNVAGKSDQGAAYLFVRSGESWVQQARLLADDGAAADEFGVAVALSDDSALLGAHQADLIASQDNQGAAYLFPVEPIPVDLILRLTANPAALVLPGQTLRYTIDYGNTGGTDATGVTITATVPAHTRFNATDSDNGWSCPDGSGPSTRCTATVGAVTAKGAGALTFAVTVDQALTTAVTQLVADAFIVDDGVHGADLIPQTNRGFAYTPVAATPLVVSKHVFPTIAQPGDVVTYTIAITAAQTGVTVVLTDTLPPGLTFERLINNTATVQLGPPTQIRFAGTIPAGNSIQIAYRAIVNAQRGSILFNETIVDSNGLRYAGLAAVSIPRTQAVHTLMLIYANGNNDLAPAMVELFQKAESAAGAPGWETLFLLDGPGNDDTYSYLLQADPNQSENCPTAANPTCGNRYREKENRWRWGDDTSTYSSVKEFVTHAVQTYPAERVLLALVGHGGGWSPDFLPGQPPFHDEKPTGDPLGGLLWDTYPSLSLSTADLGRALRDSKAETGIQIDLLYLDACLMAMAEVAYEVQESVDYLLASENWSWTSFRYDQHLAVGTQLSVAELGEQWIRNEAGELRGDDLTRVNYPFTYSLLHLRAMELLLAQETALADALQDSLPSQKAQIQAAFQATECFDGNQDYAINTNDYYCDLFSFTQQLEEHLPNNLAVVQAAQAVQATIQESLVLTTTSNNGRPWPQPEQIWQWEALGGVSIYLPLGKDDWKRSYYTAAHLRSAAEGRWDEFLNSYWGAPAPAAPTTCLPDCPVVRPDFLVNHRLYLPVITKVVPQ